MSQTQLVGIYRLYKLGRMNGKTFDTSIKVIDRDLHPVHHSFAEDSNSNSEINGLLYVEDKEATKLYWQKKPYDNVKEFTPFEEIKPDAATGIAPHIDPIIPSLPEGTEDTTGIKEITNKLSEMTKEQLIEFAEKNDFKVTKTKKAENILLELIDQIDVKE